MTLASEFKKVYHIRLGGKWTSVVRCNKCFCILLSDDRKAHRDAMHRKVRIEHSE